MIDRRRVEDIKVRGGIFDLLDVLEVPLARLPIGKHDACTRSGLHYSASALRELLPDVRSRKYASDALRQRPWWHITKTLACGCFIALR